VIRAIRLIRVPDRVRHERINCRTIQIVDVVAIL
jgi:hypothetical protein